MVSVALGPCLLRKPSIKLRSLLHGTRRCTLRLLPRPISDQLLLRP